MSFHHQEVKSREPGQELAWRLISRMSAVIFELDLPAMSLKANEPFTQATGYATEELQGRNFFDLLFPGDLRPQAEACFRQIQEHDVMGVEVALARKDGARAVFELSTANRYGQNGALETIVGLGIDVTRRKMADEALHLSKARYRAIIEDQTELICRSLPDGRLTFANQAYCRNFGKSYEELIGKTFFPRVAEEDRQRLVEEIGQLSPTTPEFTSEHRVLVPSGEIRWQQWINRAILDSEGRLVEIQSVGRDITKRKQAELALQRQTGFVKLLQEVAVAANEAVEIETAVQIALDRVLTHTGWQVGHAWIRENFQGDLVSLKVWCLENPQRLEGFRRESEALRLPPGLGLSGMAIKKGVPIWYRDVTEVENFLRREAAREAGLKTGAVFPILAGKNAVGVLEFFTDQVVEPDEALQEVMAHIGTQLGRVVERRQMEIEMTELQRRLMDGREAERVQLARELHDGPLQDLYGISFNFKVFYEELPETVDKGPAEALQDALHQVTRTLRQITVDLRPPTLDHFGLEKAIRSHAALFTEAHPQLRLLLNLAPDGQTLPEMVRLALFRIYQHAMANVLHHSRATQVEIRLEIEPGQVWLIIQDDGEGFVVPARWIDVAREGHLGLAGAAERASAIGGHMQVESSPGKGTRVSVMIRRPAQSGSTEAAVPGKAQNESSQTRMEV